MYPTRYRTRHFFNTFTTNEDNRRNTDTHYRHTTDTHYRHTLQTHTTDTHYRHTTDTHYRHTLQTHYFSFLAQRTYSCSNFVAISSSEKFRGLVASGTRCIILMYLLTAIGLPPGGSSTVHIYTQTVHRTTQKKQSTEQHNNLGDSQTDTTLP